MTVALKYSDGKQERLFPVNRDKYLIGRADDCQLRPSASGVSRHHCVVIVEPPEVSIRDLGSSNGTFVNGERISGGHRLKSGDMIAIGPLKLEVLIVPEPGQEEEDDDDVVIDSANSALLTDFGSSDEADAARWIGEAVPTGDTHIMSAEEADELRRDLAGRTPRQAPAVPKGSTTDAASEALKRLYQQKKQ